MEKKPPVRVVLDLETTGLHAEQDSILEIAAIKFQGPTILDRFETLVSPGRSIPYRIQRLTGITPQQLTGAPHFSSIARQLQTFLGDFPIVGHSIPFDVSFLRRHGLARTNPLIDTFELATVLLPSLPSYNLGQVAKALNIPVSPGLHRAMVDTMLAMQVFLALHDRLQTIDLLLLKDLASLDAPRSWPLLAFFRQELRTRQEQDGLRGSLLRGSLGDRFAAQLGMDPRILSFAIAHESDLAQELPPSGAAASASLDTLEQAQTLIEIVPEQDTQPEAARVDRRGYAAAHKAVRQALEQCSSLLLEVTVGGDDYTAVLLPALEWLIATSTTSLPNRLVIACSSQQEARRLMKDTLPRLQAMLKSNVATAYLAEQGGYLCIHRWFGAALRRTSGELTAEQARGLAKLGLWAQQTTTGERSELTMLPQEITAWERISSGVERVPLADGRSDTAYQRCIYRRKGYCFVSKAEERINKANIVVTTHAGLFHDLSQPHSLLTSITHRVLLDADLLEEEHARWSTVELDKTRLQGMLSTVGTELADGRYQGLLALAAPALRENGPGGLSTTHTVGKAELDSRMLGWFQALRQARTAVDAFFKTLSHLLEEAQQQGGNGGRDKGRGDTQTRYGGRPGERTDQPLRLAGHLRNLSAWAEVENSWQQAAQRLQIVIDLAHEAEKIILTTQRSRHRLDLGSSEDDSVALELAAIAQQLFAQKQLGQQAITLSESEMVYWLRLPPPAPPATQQMAQQRTIEAAPIAAQTPESVPVLYAQVVQTSAFLKRLLFRPGSCAILAGTALSVEGSFSFNRAHLGLEQETCPALSIVSEHHEQTLIYLPNDVPEPNTPQYQRHLDEALVQLATAVEGQLVVLFTSHAALRSSYSAVKPVLEARGILVLGHGIDGSPRHLWNTFHEQERVMLLGTGNFWESAEEITRAPACVFITRLPMPVLHDPPLAARAEHYSDQLHQVTVPVAALRMRRALNRIAWSGPTRNAIIIFDRRIISKEYGPTILHTLPRCSQRQGGISHMPETVLDWLTTTGSWD